MKFTKKATPLFLHGAYIVALFCLLGLSVIILWNNSVAWFANNKKVGADGAQVTLKDLGITDKYYAKKGDAEYAEITNWAHIFDKLSPGDTVSIKAEYQSTADAERTIKVYFENLNGIDTPLTKEVTSTAADGSAATETRYYYLGTQLRIKTGSVTLTNGTKNTACEGQFLTATPDNKIYYTAEQVPNKIELGSFNAVKDTTYTVEFTVEFVNYPDIDQNDYQGYSDGQTESGEEKPENCLRQVVAYVEE